MIYGRAVHERVAAVRYGGALPDATHHAEASNPVCGDRAELWLKVEEGLIVGVSWKALGCPPTLAAMDILAERLRGVPLVDAAELDDNVILAELPDLPTTSRHAIGLALTVLHRALAFPENT